MTGQRYDYHAYGGSWVVCDLESNDIVAVRPDLESAKTAADRLNRTMRSAPDLAALRAELLTDSTLLREVAYELQTAAASGDCAACYEACTDMVASLQSVADRIRAVAAKLA
jgi:hypothetical protein